MSSCKCGMEADSRCRERSGLLANSVCFVSKCVLWYFAVFCGCFAGVLWCRMFCNVLDVFCDFCQNFLSERKMHSTVLRCIAHAYFVRFVRFVYFLVCFVLFCEKR